LRRVEKTNIKPVLPTQRKEKNLKHLTLLAASAALTLMTTNAFATSPSVGGTVDVGSFVAGGFTADSRTDAEFEYGNVAGATVKNVDRAGVEKLDIETFSVNFGDVDIDHGRPTVGGVQAGGAAVSLPDIGCIVCD
jgi:hypothetical protein